MEDDGMIVAMDDKGSLDIRCLEIVFFLYKLIPR